MSDNNININTPEIGPYTQLKPFRFWCQKVLPLVYDESLSYYELLCKVVDYLNKTMEDVDQMIADMGDFQTAYTDFTTETRDAYIAFSREVSQAVEGLETFVNNYFNNLDVQQEINNKLDAMAAAGYFNTLFATLFTSDIITEAGNVTSAWIAANLLQETGYVIDKSLTVANAAADALAAGSAITNAELLQHMTNDNIFFELPNDIWQVGEVTTNGAAPVRNDRCSTKCYIPVSAGDIIFIGLNIANLDSMNIWYFDEDKTYLSTSSWYELRGHSVYSFTVAQNGFVKFQTGSGTLSRAYNEVMIKRAHKIDYKLNKAYDIDYSGNMIVKEYTVSSDLLAYGAISSGVVNIGDKSRIVTKYPIPVKKGFLIYQDTVETPGNMYAIINYDEEMTYIDGTDYTIYPYRVAHDGFINLIFKGTSTDLNIEDFDNLVKIVEIGDSNVYKSLFVKDEARVNYLTADDLCIGSFTGSTNIVDTRVDRMRPKTIYPVNKGDIVQINLPYVAMYVLILDDSYNIIETSDWITKQDGKTTFLQGDYKIKNDGYLLINFYAYDTSYNSIDDLTDLIDNYDGIVTIVHPINKYGDLITYKETEIITKRPFLQNRDITISQDGCVIGGNLWIFNEDGTIDIRNKETLEQVTTKTCTLGHVNSVSYNPINDCLITFGSNGTNQPTIVIYEHPGAAASLLIGDAIVIPLYDGVSYMNISASLCWGEDNQTIYYCDGVYSGYVGGEYVKNDTYNIYRIQLGLGDNDLSGDGYGTFIADKADDEYNGTCKVIKTFSGEIRNGTDVLVYRSNLATPQGMEYDGYIYLAWGTSGHNFVTIALDDTTSEYRVINNYMYHDYEVDRTEVFYEPELLALDGSTIITGSRTTGLNPKYLLQKFNRLA